MNTHNVEKSAQFQRTGDEYRRSSGRLTVRPWVHMHVSPQTPTGDAQQPVCHNVSRLQYILHHQ